jgi:hypothetical protein
MANPIKPTPQEIKDAISNDDYARDMFKDGKNGASHSPREGDSRAYDKVVHLGAPALLEEADNDTDVTMPLEAAHSRDGTESAGEYDESGGPIGGTEEEIDAMEATGAPVDRTPQMKR